MPRLRVWLSLILLLLGCAGKPAPDAAAPGENAVEPAEVAVAPEVSTPAGILKEYQALGLPLPPASARLVRLDLLNTVTPASILAFELEPGVKRARPRLLWGTAEGEFLVKNLRVAAPDADAARGLYQTGDLRLALIAQCQFRGWNALADELMVQHRDAAGGGTHRMLLDLAWNHWEGLLSHPTDDRRPAVAGIKTIMRRDPRRSANPEARDLLKSLELALVLGTAKAGTAEALIDELVDKTPNDLRLEEPGPDHPYRRLAERGFDAVPALIAALDDDRLTRVRVARVDRRPGDHMRVRHVVSDLLEWLAAEQLPRGPEVRDKGQAWWNRQAGHAVTRAAAEEWWAKARKTGEEAHVLAHVFPSENVSPLRPAPIPVNAHILSLIAAKYPTRLPEVYRDALSRRPAVQSGEVAAALARSAVPAREKIELLSAGVAHADDTHRVPALAALRPLDPKRVDELVLAEIEALPPDGGGARLGVAHLVLLSDDSRLWAALAAAARRSAAEQRGSLLFRHRTEPGPGTRVEYVRLMAGFLDDETVFGERPHTHDLMYYCDGIEVRNYAAYSLARPLGIVFEMKRGISPAEWAKLRDEVRAAARRELDRQP